MAITARRKTWFTAGIYAMMFACALCSSAQGTLLTDFISYYGLESSAQGLASAAQSAGNIAAIFLIGLLVGKLQKHTILYITAAAVPSLYFLLGMRPRFTVLLGAFLVYGVVFGFLDSLASSLMADLYREQSARYMNLLHGIYGVGGFAGPLLIQRLRLWGMAWYNVLTVCGCCAAVASAVYIGGALGNGAALGRERQAAVCPADVAAYLTQRRKRRLLACAFLYGAHQIGITVWVTRYISEYLGAPRWGAPALSCFWAGTMAARLLFSRFSLRRARFVFRCHAVTAAILLCGVLAGNGFVMMVCCGLAGFSEGAILPLTLDIACGWEREKTHVGSTMLLFTHYVGFIVSAPAIAFVIAHAGILAGMLLPVAFSACAAFFAHSLIRYDEAAR